VKNLAAAEGVGELIVTAAQCKASTNDSVAELNCMRQKPVLDLIYAYMNVSENGDLWTKDWPSPVGVYFDVLSLPLYLIVTTCVCMISTLTYD
jgi:hypothetical protein